jgi:hypothetical protein
MSDGGRSMKKMSHCVAHSAAVADKMSAIVTSVVAEKRDEASQVIASS